LQESSIVTGRIYPTPTVVDEGGARNLHRTATPGSSRAGGPTCDLWQETGYVFTTAIGLPINTSTDYHAWKRLLPRAGVAERRLHAARHTAATVLLLLGVPERTVMSVMG
jgi:integrase